MVDRTQEDINQDERIKKIENDLAALVARFDRQKDWAQSAISHLQNVVAPLAKVEGDIGSVRDWLETHSHRLDGLEAVRDKLEAWMQRVDALIQGIRHKLGL